MGSYPACPAGVWPQLAVFGPGSKRPHGMERWSAPKFIALQRPSAARFTRSPQTSPSKMSLFCLSTSRTQANEIISQLNEAGFFRNEISMLFPPPSTMTAGSGAGTF